MESRIISCCLGRSVEHKGIRCHLDILRIGWMSTFQPTVQSCLAFRKPSAAVPKIPAPIAINEDLMRRTCRARTGSSSESGDQKQWKF